MAGAPRERRPALAVLAVILILGGALATGALVVKSAQRVNAIEVTAAIGQGEQIPASALQEVQISASSNVRYVSWSFASQVTQFFANNAIPAGTLLNSGMVSRTNNLSNGRAEVGLALKDGQLPDGLEVGQTVNIYSTQTSTSGCPGGPGALIGPDAVVIGINPGANGNGNTDVEVALNPGSSGAVVCNTANGTAGIAVMPTNATS
jgi:hypothetical protein